MSMTFEQQQAGELKLIAASLNKRLHTIEKNMTPTQKLDAVFLQGLNQLDDAMQKIYAAARRFEGAL